MKYYLSLIFTALFFSCSNESNNKQTFLDEKIIPETYVAESVTEYFAVYHFGMSEMETDLIINGSNGNYYAQIKSGSFNEDATDFIWHYENLKNVRIEGNKFYSDKTNGEFVAKDGVQGLRLDKSWSAMTEDDGSEISYSFYSVDNYYAGNYTQASLKLFTEKELRAFTKAELELMRNEIFARYGNQFKAGGKMDNYFKGQNWYKSQHKNVDVFLTWLEKDNIKLIKKVEAYALDEDLEYGIEDFPKEWIGLTKNEASEFIIEQPCLAYNHSFSLGQYPNGKWYIDMMKPFDSERFDIVDFEYTGNPIYQQYQGRISIENIDPEGGEPVIHPFWWNRLEKRMEFKKFYGETLSFVSGENKDKYKTVKEPCDEDEHY